MSPPLISFVFAPAFSLHFTMVSKCVTSSDGAQIYTEAYGDPSKPALILVAGYTMNTIAFEKQIELSKDLYLVSSPTSATPLAEY